MCCCLITLLIARLSKRFLGLWLCGGLVVVAIPHHTSRAHSRGLWPYFSGQVDAWVKVPPSLLRRSPCALCARTFEILFILFCGVITNRVRRLADCSHLV